MREDKRRKSWREKNLHEVFQRRKGHFHIGGLYIIASVGLNAHEELQSQTLGQSWSGILVMTSSTYPPGTPQLVGSRVGSPHRVLYLPRQRIL